MNSGQKYLKRIDSQEHFLEVQFEAAKSERPDPLNVLDSLAKLFTFLGDSFDVPVAEDSDKTFMECLGEVFGSKLKDLLIKGKSAQGVTLNKSLIRP
jgi:hypothetical protein